MQIKRLLVTGCSLTSGAGWNPDRGDDCKSDPRLWINIAHQHTPALAQLKLENLSSTGASNSDVFEQTVTGLSRYTSIDTVIVQWTGMPRYNFNVGFELWSTSDGTHNGLRQDHHLSDGTTWSASYIQDVVDRFRVLHHLHWEILHVVRYCNVLTKLAHRLGIDRIFFINGLCPWDQGYFERLQGPGVLPEHYTKFTKQDIININSHNDQDIFRLYQQLHDHYDKAGGVNPAQWINLYDSMRTTQVDTNFDNVHPGIQSNLNFSQKVQEFFKAS